MHKVLFVCTANIFRSRFSEEVYNHLVNKNNIPSTAFSAGLMVGSYKTRKIYRPALEQLNAFNIKPLRENELSIHVDDLCLSDYKKIICMDEEEHKPMVDGNNNLKNRDLEYWNIVDEPKVSGDISLPNCYRKVEELVYQISTDLTF